MVIRFSAKELYASSILAVASRKMQGKTEKRKEGKILESSIPSFHLCFFPLSFDCPGGEMVYAQDLKSCFP